MQIEGIEWQPECQKYILISDLYLCDLYYCYSVLIQFIFIHFIHD